MFNMLRRELVAWSTKLPHCNLIVLHCGKGLTICVKDNDEQKEKASDGRKNKNIPTRGLKGNVHVHWQSGMEVRVALIEHERL
jgi:hypothetical protein